MNLAEHYEEENALIVEWSCGRCNQFEYTSLSAISSHVTRCARRAGSRSFGRDEGKTASSSSAPGNEEPCPSGEHSVQESASSAQSAVPSSPPTKIQTGEWTRSELVALARLRIKLGPRVPARELRIHMKSRQTTSISKAMQSARYRQVLKEVREGTTTAETSADVDDHDSEGCPGTVGGAAADAFPGTADAPVPVHHRPCPPPSTHPSPPSRLPDPHYAATDEGCHLARDGSNGMKGLHPAPGPVMGRQRAQIGRCTSSTGPADRPLTLLGGTCTSSAGPADSHHELPVTSSSPGYIVYEPEIRSSPAAKRLQKGRLIINLASSEDSSQEEDGVAEGAQAVPSEVAVTSCEDGSGGWVPCSSTGPPGGQGRVWSGPFAPGPTSGRCGHPPRRQVLRSWGGCSRCLLGCGVTAQWRCSAGGAGSKHWRPLVCAGLPQQSSRRLLLEYKSRKYP